MLMHHPACLQYIKQSIARCRYSKAILGPIRWTEKAFLPKDVTLETSRVSQPLYSWGRHLFRVTPFWNQRRVDPKICP